MKTRKEIESEIARLQGLLKNLPESGKWYFVDKLREGCFGFSGLGKIVEDFDVSSGLLSYEHETLCIRGVDGVTWRINSDAEFTEAKDRHVQEAFIKEARRIYGDDWMNIRIKEHADGQEWVLKEGEFASGYSNSTDRFYNKNGVLYHDGRWAKAAPSVSVGDWMFLRGRGFKLVGSENQGKALLGSGWSVVTDLDMILELDKYNA